MGLQSSLSWMVTSLIIIFIFNITNYQCKWALQYFSCLCFFSPVQCSKGSSKYERLNLLCRINCLIQSLLLQHRGQCMVGHNCPSCRQLGKKLSSQQKQVNEEGSGGSNSKSGECFIKLLLLHSTPRPSQILQLNWKSLQRLGWGTWLTSTHLLQSFRSTALVKYSKLCWNIHKRTLVTSGKHLLEEERYMPVFLLREGVYKKTASLHKNGSPGSPYSADIFGFLRT